MGEKYGSAELEAVTVNASEVLPWHDIREDGVFVKPVAEIMRVGGLVESEARQLRWTPRGGHAPALPVPFTSRELASFCLAGGGLEILERWDGLDDDKIENALHDEPAAAEALIAALGLIRQAHEKFGLGETSIQPEPADPGDTSEQRKAKAERHREAVREQETRMRLALAAAVAWLLDAESGEPAPPLPGNTEDTAAGNLPERSQKDGETPAERAARRLAEFEKDGGVVIVSNGVAKLGGERGALQRLADRERAAGRPRADRSDMAKELKAEGLRRAAGQAE